MSVGVFLLLMASIGCLIAVLANRSFERSRDPFLQPIVLIIGAMMGVGGAVCLLIGILAAMLGP